jgi:hypothetical protein
MHIPTDTNIERIITDATYIAKRSDHALAWHAVQQLQQLRAPLHTQVERNAAFDAVSKLYTTRGFSFGDCAYEGVIDDLDDLMLRLARYMDNDAIAAEAAAFGAGAVETAIDRQGEHESLDDALYSYQINAFDTLREVFGSLHGDGRYANAWRAMDRAFRAALVKHGLTFNG